MKKKNENKGFTLVELIVVLVILAILAAILVPALLGYIDRARNQQIVLNAKTYMTATQAELSSLYGQNVKASDLTTKLGTDAVQKRIQDTADVPECTLFEFATKSVDTTTDPNSHAAFTVAFAVYGQGDKYIYFDGSAWIEAKTKADAEGAKPATGYGSFITVKAPANSNSNQGQGN